MKSREINLTKGKTTVVDDEDFDYLNQWKWHCGSGYAMRRKWGINRTSEIILMHRVINKTPLGFFTDHINRNKLDNRKENLRTVTKSQNGFNTNLSKRNKSGFTGVQWNKINKNWRATIMINGKITDLGSYREIEKAVMARSKAKEDYFHS